MIGQNCIVGAKTVVPLGREIPPRSLVLGAPGKVVRELTEEEIAGLTALAQKYVTNARYCLKHGINVGAPLAG